MPEFSRYRQPTCVDEDVMDDELQTIFLYNDIFNKTQVKELLLEKDPMLRKRYRDFDKIFQSLEDISAEEQAFRADIAIHMLLKEANVQNIVFMNILKQPWKVVITQRAEQLVFVQTNAVVDETM